jgi:hypothetical protein
MMLFLQRRIMGYLIIVLAVLAIVTPNDLWAGLVTVVSAWAANSPHVKYPSSWRKMIRTEKSGFLGFSSKDERQRDRGGSIDSGLAAETAKAEASSQIAPSEMVSVENLSLLSDRGRGAVQRLVEYDADRSDQAHVYGNWPPPGIDDNNKRRLAEQVRSCDLIFRSIFSEESL